VILEKSQDLRILYWNIRHGGGSRANQIGQAVAGYNPDLIIFGEYRNGPAFTKIRTELDHLGLSCWHATTPTPGLNGLTVATRCFIDQVCQFPDLGGDRHRILQVEVEGISLLCCYFPQGRDKIPVFEFVLNWASSFRNMPALVIGDLNTGKHEIDEVGSTFIVPEYLNRIEATGFVDGWRRFHGPTREYSWYSNFGNGFRIDHAYLSPALLPYVQHVRYSHGERESGLSDHSIMIVELGSARSQEATDSAASPPAQPS
jgi:exonuclease III